METRSVSIDLPLTVTIKAPNVKEFDTINWTADFILECCLHGIKQRRSDKHSTEKKDKDAALAKLDARILAGEVLTGSDRGPSGPRDADAKADSDWLAAKGYKGAIKDTAERWKGYVRAKVIEKDATLARVENRDALEEAVAYNKEEVVAMVRATTTWKAFRGLMDDDIAL